MDKYNSLFNQKRYYDEETVSFSNNSLGDNAYTLAESLCLRLINIGNAYEIHYLSMIDIYGMTKLNKNQILSLIEELLFVKSIVNDELIEKIVPGLTELLEKISRSKNEEFLWIIGN